MGLGHRLEIQVEGLLGDMPMILNLTLSLRLSDEHLLSLDQEQYPKDTLIRMFPY